MTISSTKITPCLWFDDQAEEATEYYVSIFKNSAIRNVARYGDGPRAGSVLSIEFELDGQPFDALNGGPEFKFTEAVSFIVNCETQDEVDYYWDRLSAGGDEAAQQCGWLKDRFGVSWQVIPQEFYALINDPDPIRAQRAVQAMLQMKKLDVNAMRRAQEEETQAA